MSLRTPYDTVKDTVKTAFLNLGLSEEQVEACSVIHTQPGADGVESHGFSHIPHFAEYVQKGWINLEGKLESMGVRGAVENYDGHLRVGITDILYRTDHVMELAKVHGIDYVSLKSTTHQMRDGTYAWRMTEAGFMGISWISTKSCVPLWGSDGPGVGDNPSCIAIPREDEPVALDMAMSQYAYGKLGVYRLVGRELLFPGGLDKNGNLTSDPEAIERSEHILPTRYWRDSEVATVLDMAATLMVNGNCRIDIDEANNGSCADCYQIFIAFDPYLFGNEEDIQTTLNKRVAVVDTSHPEREGGRVTCPGERIVTTRVKGMADGVCVDEAIWAQAQSPAAGSMETEDIANK